MSTELDDEIFTTFALF